MSNNQMVSVMQREDRYIVIKRSDLDKIPGKQRMEFSRASRIVHDRMFAAGAPPRQFLVIESDWPEYELAWVSIEARVLGSGATTLTGSRLLELHSSELRAARMEIATLRAQLSERDALIADALIAFQLDVEGRGSCQNPGLDFIRPWSERVGALSASAEPSYYLKSCKAIAESMAEPSAPVEIDERAAFDAWHAATWPNGAPTEARWLTWQARAALERKP